MKPCETPCPKCGSPDVHRQFCAKDSRYNADKYNSIGVCNKFVRISGWVCVSLRDHIANQCRCCQYQWNILPMGRPRKKRKGRAASKKES